MLLGWFLEFAMVPISATRWVTSLIDLGEDEQEWRDEECVHGKQRDDEVPDLAEGTLGVNEVPLELWHAIDDLVLFISIFIDIVDHHFF